MTNLFDKLKSKIAQNDAPSKMPTKSSLIEGNNNGESALPAGSDARRAAEIKAEEAGAKWRESAEKRGEVPKEIGGPKGLEPTRYGDWEKAGRCYDF